MIDKDRPICVVVYESARYGTKGYCYPDPLNGYTLETIDPETDREPYPDNTFDHYIAEACAATWCKKDESSPTQHFIEVKCMEPANWYIKIPNAYGGKIYCDYHKPRLRSL